MRSIRILGSRGVPAAHGGFETFAGHLSSHLVRRGWEVTVYCHARGDGPIAEDRWRGVRRVIVAVPQAGALGTMVYDWLSIRHALREQGLVLTLGYNTAIFGIRFRLGRIPHLMNMDGVEWKREKWPLPVKAWFLLNQIAASWIADHLVADNPRIADLLAWHTPRRRITTIPYGADEPSPDGASALERLGLEPGRYLLVVARAEPENSVLEIVRAHARAGCQEKLVVLGKYPKERGGYQRKVLASASAGAIFPGAVYEPAEIGALRRHAVLYIHGHRVGGTNPSLVEALAAACPVLAFDNSFNRWVAGDAARYFRNEEGCARELARLLASPGELARLRQAARTRHAEEFTQEKVLGQYEALLERWIHAQRP